MAYYFRDEQIDKVMSLIPDEHVHKQEHVKGAEIAKQILGEINFKNFAFENDVLWICIDKSATSYDSYSEKECAEIENDLKAEIKDVFGLDAEVDFMQTGSYEKEPDILPPMYWGGTETVYVYSLTVKVVL